jgi:hypothetical protein
MQVERQQRSDCQGNATANGEEYRSWYCSGFRQMPVLSEIYAYNASEYRMQPSQVGKDQGSSIHSGVRVLVEGIPSLGVAQDCRRSRRGHTQITTDHSGSLRQPQRPSRFSPATSQSTGRYLIFAACWQQLQLGEAGISGPSGEWTGKTLEVRSGAWTGCREAVAGTQPRSFGLWRFGVGGICASGIRTATAIT